MIKNLKGIYAATVVPLKKSKSINEIGLKNHIKDIMNQKILLPIAKLDEMDADQNTKQKQRFSNPVLEKKPISIENKYLHQEGHEENTGIVVYSNNSLRGMGVEENSKINFSKDSEYKFVVNDETLYRMRTKDVCTILS